MTFYITVLRAIAACFITNAHYTGIYPTDLIANGGLIGDILFFAVSGYCLYNIKLPFVRWYGKRIYRVYLPVIVITAIYMVTELYHLHDHSITWWYIYPTYYHFVASIVLLYVPFYFVMRVQKLRANLKLVMLAVAIIWAIVYFTVYDRSTYHIDSVHEPFIKFLFFESMLLGAEFRRNDNQIRNQFHWWFVAGTIISFILYFTSKMVFSHYPELSAWQFANQLIIFALLYFIMCLFASIDQTLSKMPRWLNTTATGLSKITLEIYIVQYAIIDRMRSISFFPVNWLLLTGTIILAAIALHLLCKLIYRLIDTIIDRILRHSVSNKNAV